MATSPSDTAIGLSSDEDFIDPADLEDYEADSGRVEWDDDPARVDTSGTEVSIDTPHDVTKDVSAMVDAGAASEEIVESTHDDAEDPALCSYSGHGSEPVYAVALHGGIALSGGGDDKGHLWSLETGESIAELSGHTDSVISVAFSNTDDMCATASMDGTVRVWNLSGELLHVLDGPAGDIEWIAWHPKGPVLLAGSSDGSAWMWLASSGSFLMSFYGHDGSVTTGCFAAKGKLVVTGCEDGALRVWNPKSEASSTPQHVFRGPGWHDSPIVSIAAHPAKPLVLSGAAEGTLRLVNVRKSKVLASLQHAGSPMAPTSTAAPPVDSTFPLRDDSRSGGHVL